MWWLWNGIYKRVWYRNNNCGGAWETCQCDNAKNIRGKAS